MCIFFVGFDGSGVLYERQGEARVPVIMYHLVTERGKYIGRYGITPAELESDLKYLQANGYSTVVIRDLTDFVQRGKKLPEKPVMLTFDDGNASDLHYVLPLLEKYDMTAVFSVIGEAVDRCSKEQAANPKAKLPNLTWPQLREMHASGRCEIQSHGYDVHGRRGAAIRSGEGTEAYHTRLRGDLQKLQDLFNEHLGFTPEAFTYPLGFVSKEAHAVLEDMGFVSTLSCIEGMNVIKQGEPEGLILLKRSNRPNGKHVKILLDALEK
jgi:peptidoglycan/xylan/chitin deacetylase (PgdA/CDA1 family)